MDPVPENIQVIPPAPIAPPHKLPVKLSVLLPVVAMVAALPFLARSVLLRQLTGSRAAAPDTYCVDTFGCPTPTPACPNTAGCIPTPTFTATPSPIITPIATPTQVPVPTATPTPIAINNNPVIGIPLNIPVGRVGSTYTLAITGTDIDNDNLRMSASSVPAAFGIGTCVSTPGNITCRLTGIPQIDGTYAITIKLMDTRGGKSQTTVSLQVIKKYLLF